MPSFEHAITVEEPLEYVVEALSSPEATPLFAPSIVRITLDASDDGRAADLTYERIRTGARPPLGHPGRDASVLIEASFAGPGVDGRLAYHLTPEERATRLGQRVEYEFTGGATVDVLASATDAHNDRQFADQLSTVRDLLEAGSRVFPPLRGDPEPTVRSS